MCGLLQQGKAEENGAQKIMTKRDERPREGTEGKPGILG